MNVITRAIASFKAMTQMQWGRTTSWFSMLLGGTTFDYRASAGDGRTNAAVMACIRWAQRTLPEAPLQVITRNTQGELTPVPNHPLQQRLENPNPFYSGLHLIGAVVADLMLYGNAYVIKARTRESRVVQLWWVPATLIEPKWPDNDTSVYISHYEYRVEGEVVDIPVQDVIHFRQGFDPQNVRKGMSDLAALWREIASDNEAANWTGSLLRNGAVPGVIISPEQGTMAMGDDLEQIKDTFIQRFGGDERGKPMVVGAPIKTQVLSFNPQEMNLREVRIVPEERITAMLGIPAIVVGLGAGLQRSTFANFAEAREAAYESFVIPMQRLIMAELQNQLVPDFGDPTRLRLVFDLSQVRVLQVDQDALHNRARANLLAGGITLNQFLETIGEDPLTGPEGDVRYVPGTITVTPPDRLIPPEQPAIAEVPPGSDDGEDEESPGPRPLAAAGATNGHHKGSIGDRAGTSLFAHLEPGALGECPLHGTRERPAYRAANRHPSGQHPSGCTCIAGGNDGSVPAHITPGAAQVSLGDTTDGQHATSVAQNGHHKAAAADLGPALVLNEDDLDRLSQVGPEDVPGADRFWRRVVDDDLGDLLDARPENE